MQPIVYYYSKKQAKELDKIVENPLFSKIITYFFENKQEEILLRTLKKEFSMINNLEFFLEKLIVLQLIQRKNRRYTLNFPIFSEKNTIELSVEIKKILTQMVEEMQQIRLDFFLGEQLWKFLFADDVSYFFGVFSSETFYNRREVSTASVSIVSILPKNSSIVDLATYFDTLATDQSMGLIYQPLLELVGDISRDYYFSQVKKTLRKAPIKAITTIFDQSLLLTGHLKENEKGVYALQTPLFKLEDYESLNFLTFHSLQPLLAAYWQEVDCLEEQAYIKHCLFQSILAYLGGASQQSMTYFIKK